MSNRLYLPYIALWLALSLVASGIEVGGSRARYEDAFQTDARIMHRLLSQRAAQHEAILATLALLQPGAQSVLTQEVQRLPAVYPQIVRAERWITEAPWAGELPAPLAAAAAESQRLRHAMLAAIDARVAHYWVVLAARPASYALEIDVHAMVPWEEWPLPRQGSPVRVALQQGVQEIVVSTGAPDEAGWLGQRLSFNKTIASDSQPFNVAVSRQLDWRSLPWGRLAAWWLGCAALCGLLA